MAKQFDYQQIIDTYRNLHQQANAANESRYQSILQTHNQNMDRLGASYGQAFDLVSSIGDAERERIDMGEQRSLASTEQDLINRGLGQTTIRQSARRGVRDDAARNRRELQESIAKTQAGVVLNRADAEERQGNYLTGVMERRTDRGPDLSSLNALLQQYGAGVGAGGDEPKTVFTGLSANARAGRDAFGNQMGTSTFGGSPSPGAPTFGLRGTGGGGGTSARTIYGGSTAGSGNNRIIRGAAQSAAGAAAGGAGGTGAQMITGGGVNPDDAGVGGSAFDNMFVGQPVFGDGQNIGTYGGGGELSSAELVDSSGNLDTSRLDLLGMNTQGGGDTAAAPTSGGGDDRNAALRRQLQSQLNSLERMDQVRSGGMTAYERQQYNDITNRLAQLGG